MAGIDQYTKLLLHCDGADGSTSFPDSSDSGHTVTANGDAQVDTAQSKFGGASGLFDGNSDNLTIPDSDDWSLGSADFTLDWWIRFNAAIHNANYIGQIADGNNRWGCAYNSNVFYAMYIVDSATAKADYNKAWSPSTNTWYHIAVVRSGDDILWFVDGVEQNPTATVSLPAGYSLPNLGSVAHIGGYSNDGFFNGWMDEVRVSKGIARWTSNFTPPTASYSRPSGFGIGNPYIF